MNAAHPAAHPAVRPPTHRLGGSPARPVARLVARMGMRAPRRRRALAVWAVLALAPWLAHCASQEERVGEFTAEKLYQQAQEKQKKRLYIQALLRLDALRARFPESPYAVQAQLERIDALYRGFDHVGALDAATQFIQLHPQHPKVDYAYYMRGLAAFDQAQRSIGRFGGQMGARNIGPARDAYQGFTQFLAQFPSSRHAADARQRLAYLRELLAAHEIYVGQHYMSLQAWLAAASRGHYVLNHFPRTRAIPEALRIMVIAYRRLDQPALAADALALLAANYPGRVKSLR